MLINIIFSLIGTENIDTLWGVLVDKALSFEDEEIGLEWFHKLLDTDVSREIDLVLHIFEV